MNIKNELVKPLSEIEDGGVFYARSTVWFKTDERKNNRIEDEPRIGVVCLSERFTGSLEYWAETCPVISAPNSELIIL